MNNTANIVDPGNKPFVVDVEKLTDENSNFRTALWTGSNLQMTLMSVPVGQDIGLEIHHGTDQFLRIEQGSAIVEMGKTKDNLDFRAKADPGFGIFIPAETWHNVINTSNIPLKVYSIYAPPHHAKGTVHETKEIAEASEHDH